MKKRTAWALAALAVVLVMAWGMPGDAATTLTGNLELTVNANFANSVDLGGGSLTQQLKKSQAIANGTGAGQADLVWTDTRTIAASTTEDLDVSGGGLTTIYGAAFTIAEMKLLCITASTANTNNVVIGGDANSVPFLSTAATTLSLKPGGVFCLTDPSAAGITVTNATGDVIQVANSGAGTGVDYSIVIMGSSS